MLLVATRNRRRPAKPHLVWPGGGVAGCSKFAPADSCSHAVVSDSRNAESILRPRGFSVTAATLQCAHAFYAA